MNAARTRLAISSSSPVVSLAVRIGQVSIRQKTTRTTAAVISAMSVNATGHEKRPAVLERE